MPIHLNLTHGEDYNDRCRTCGGETMLVTASDWKTHPPEGSDIEQDFVEVSDEISGHYCPKCGWMTALFFNEYPRKE